MTSADWTRESEIQINDRWLRGPTSKLVENPDNPGGRRIREWTRGTEVSFRNHASEPNVYSRGEFVERVTTEAGAVWLTLLVDGQWRSISPDRITTVHSKEKLR